MPGKEEFHETLRYFRRRIESTGVTLRLGERASGEALLREQFDEVVVATGIVPRRPPIEGLDHPKALAYLDVLRDDKPVGRKVAIVGAGGIGFDVAEYLVHEGESASLDAAKFFAEWGVDTAYAERGGLRLPQPARPRARSTCCSARRRRSATGSARPPAGSIARRSRRAA